MAEEPIEKELDRRENSDAGLVIKERISLRYTVPDYYKSFQCIAGDCPATCCAGWQIVIDDAALKKYKNCKTPFGNRLANSIDWKEKTFHQYAGRCAFLDERNLCDIYTEAGPDMFCRTCRNYPRHIEEFENEREISLSLSCPVVARMLLDRREKVTFVIRESEKEEQYEEFDEFLYFMLQDCRSVMFEILQDRKMPIAFRMAKVLALAHDVQNRIDARQMFDIENVLKRYQREGADEILKRKLEPYGRTSAHLRMSGQNEQSRDAEGIQTKQKPLRAGLMALLSELEVLDPSWPPQVKIYQQHLYGNGKEAYEKLRRQSEKDMDWMELEAEQLMVYFLFTYFCGAVYDGNALTKVKMAVVCTLLIQEMELGAQASEVKGCISADASDTRVLTLEDRARIAWRFSRELEHSDQNLDKMEELMEHSEAAEFEVLLAAILSERLGKSK